MITFICEAYLSMAKLYNCSLLMPIFFQQNFFTNGKFVQSLSMTTFVCKASSSVKFHFSFWQPIYLLNFFINDKVVFSLLMTNFICQTFLLMANLYIHFRWPLLSMKLLYIVSMAKLYNYSLLMTSIIRKTSFYQWQICKLPFNDHFINSKVKNI